MIKGFEEETRKLSREEIEVMHLVVELLKGHVGRSCAVSAKHIQKLLEENHFIIIAEARIRKIINHIRRHNMVHLLLANNVGYYVATDLADAKDYLKSLEQRIAAQQQVYNELQHQINESKESTGRFNFSS